MATYSNLTRASDGQFKVRPSSVGLDSAQPLNEKKLDGQKLDGMSRLGRMSVDVRSSDSIEARATQTLSQQADLSSTHVNLADLDPFEGPPSLVRDADESSVPRHDESLQMPSPQVAQAEDIQVSALAVAVDGGGGGQEPMPAPLLLPEQVSTQEQVHADPISNAEANHADFPNKEGLLAEDGQEHSAVNLSARSSVPLPNLEKLLPAMSHAADDQETGSVGARHVSGATAADFPDAPHIVEESASLSHAENPSASDHPNHTAKIDTPHSLGEIIGEGLNTFSGTTDALSAIPAGRGVSSDGIQNAATYMGIAALGLGLAAGSFAIYQQTKKINLLEKQKNDINGQDRAKDVNSDQGNSGSSPSAVLTDTNLRQIQRIDSQIKELKTERAITVGVLSTTGVLGGTTLGLALGGMGSAARVTGAALGAVGIVLSTYGAFTDAKSAMHQSNVNKQLDTGLKELRGANSQPGELTTSLQQVALHAKTSGKSRVRGKWFSMSMNLLNAFTGAAGIAFKFAVAGSAAATAGTVLLAAGGAFALGALGFGLYKLVKNKQLRNAANVPLKTPPFSSEKVAEVHDTLLKNNKYYALKQFVFDLQHNTSEAQQNTTLNYFMNALSMSQQHAEAFYAELRNSDTSAAATQVLANALFRGKAIQM